MGNALSANQTRAGAHRRLMRVLALGAALLGSTSREAAAVIIPPDLIPTPAAVSADLLFNFSPPDPIHVRTFGRHDLSGPGGRLLEDSALFPSPFLFASVPSIEDLFFGRVAAVFDYEVVILGPPGSLLVLVDASARVQAGAQPGTGGFALTAMFSEGIQTPGLSGSFGDSFDHTDSLVLTSNQRYKVRLVADAGIANGFTNGAVGFAFALIDPVFSFGAGVGPEYSFVFSEGVGNVRTSSVPKPGTFTLILVGLLALGLVRKRVSRLA
jgi:hypothetical protein